MRVRTPDELERAIDDIAYSIRQGCLAHQHYHYVVIPVLRKNGVLDATVRIVKNASLEAQLLFLRKLNEFFKPLATDKELEEDDLRAEHYAGFKSPGPFLSRPDEKEIHKRVGHITLMEARYGKKDWTELIEGSSPIAVDSLLKFFRFLRDSYPSLSSAKREDVQYYIRRLEQLKRHV